MTDCLTTYELLTQEQKDFYDTYGYLHLSQVVPEQQLATVQRPLERWVDTMIAKWAGEGLLTDAFSDLPFDRRLREAWIAAGKPTYSRSPRGEIVSEEVFDFLREETFVKLARDLIGSDCIAAHGAFNSRPKLADQSFSDTPWHQDAQYFRECAGNNIITMWMPLVDVDETNSCLQVAPGRHHDPIYDNHNHHTGFLVLPPEVLNSLSGKPIPMRRGDLLCFNEFMPHAALPNHTDTVRWSMDLRYEAIGTPNSRALDQGFICSHTDPTQIETSYDHWYQEKWAKKAGVW